MYILGEIGQWIQTTLIQLIEIVPFVENGQETLESITSWLTAGAVGGGFASIPLYQFLVARRTVRYAKRTIRKVVKWLIIIGVIALVLQFI